MPRRGRPPLIDDEVILEKALAAFAASGYDAMSVRALNLDLGLSHETISKRFGSKIELFRAAMTFGVDRFVNDLNREMDATPTTDDLERLRVIIRAFMLTASRHPTLGDLINHEGISDDERIRLVNESGMNSYLIGVVEVLNRLHGAGVIRETKLRELWFLAQGAVAPLHFWALSTMFDSIDGPVEPDELIERMTETIMHALIV